MTSDYLPECCCEGEDICPIHGPMARPRTIRRASRAVKDGLISQASYEAWLKKYAKKKPKIAFGSLNS